MYDSIFYKNSNLNFYDETGNNLVLFKDAFNQICDYPTLIITELIQISKSIQFSQSFDFSISYEFTKTSEFSKTDEFSYTLDFSKSDEFSKSFLISKSYEFIPTDCFSKSSYFSGSNEFIKTFAFSESYYFSKSIYFTKSNEFNQTEFCKQSEPSQYSTINTFIQSELSNLIQITKSFDESTYVKFSTESGTNKENQTKFYRDPTISPSKSMNPDAIAGIVIALVALIVTIIIIIYFILKKRKQLSSEEMNNNICKETTINVIHTNSTISKPNNYDEDNDLNFWL